MFNCKLQLAGAGAGHIFCSGDSQKKAINPSNFYGNSKITLNRQQPGRLWAIAASADDWFTAGLQLAENICENSFLSPDMFEM